MSTLENIQIMALSLCCVSFSLMHLYHMNSFERKVKEILKKVLDEANQSGNQGNNHRDKTK